MDDATRRRDLDTAYAALQAARAAGDDALAERLSRELRDLAPPAPEGATRRSPTRARHLRRRRVLGLVGASLVGAVLGVVAVLMVSSSVLALVVSGTVGAALGAAVLTISRGPEPEDGPIGGVSYMTSNTSG